jgi:hypothetical protein
MEEAMKWITREHVKVDRVACPWLIKHFVDKDAEFVFVPPDKVMDEAKGFDAIPYDVKNVELGHHGKECSFEAILKKYKLTDDRALVLLGKIVNGADTDNTLYQQPEGPGLEAIAEGFRHLGYKDDHALNAAEWIVYALCLLPGNGAAGKVGRHVREPLIFSVTPTQTENANTGTARICRSLPRPRRSIVRRAAILRL